MLSRSTADSDAGTKAGLYRELPSLQALLIVRQDAPAVTLYRRDGERWTVEDRRGLDVTLDVLGAELALREVYDGVALDGAPSPR